MSHHRRFSTDRSRRACRRAAGALVPVAAVAAIAAPAAHATTELAASSPAGLIQSTGNLYWTSNTQPTSTEYQASVWRASKSNSPGQETLLYQETSKKFVNFDAIKWAEVDGSYNGYFVANYANGVSKIKVVSLGGGQATTLKTAPAQIGDRDLVTDGTDLYWADAKGIRELPIGGGKIKTLVKGTTFSNLSLDSSYVYYSSSITGPDGYPEAVLSRVAKTGGKPSVLLETEDSSITALDTLGLADYTEYYLGFANAVVEEGTTIGGVSDVLQPESIGTTITSISYDAAAGSILWGEDDFLQGYNLAVWDTDGQADAVTTSAPPLDIQGDGGALYWGDEHLESTPL